MEELGATAASLRESISLASQGLIERESLVELVALSAVAGEHLLVIGPPGTAKSEAVRRVAQALGARYFEYLLGRFTEPSEIFGPIDLRKLKEGVVETETAGMLPEAELAFLDEVFLGSTAILNTLLGVLNERVFRRGHTMMKVPLRLCVGASNALPEDETLAAFSDRFLVRAFIEPIPDPRLEELLEGGWRIGSRPAAAALAGGTAVLDALAQAALHADLAPIRPKLAQAVRMLRGAGVTLTDRRAVKLQKLVAAAAVLAGRTTPTDADLWPLIFAVPTAEGQRIARDVLRELLSKSESAALSAAAAEASAGPLARAARIATAAAALLGARPAEADALEGWRLKLEGVAREVDAGFSPETLPPTLAELRAQVVEAIQQAQAGAAGGAPAPAQAAP